MHDKKTLQIINNSVQYYNIAHKSIDYWYFTEKKIDNLEIFANSLLSLSPYYANVNVYQYFAKIFEKYLNGIIDKIRIKLCW